MRKTTSKIIALLLVALTVFSMALTAGAVQFEGETDDGSWQGDCGDGGNDYQLLLSLDLYLEGDTGLVPSDFLCPMEEI